jgi:hypothetical protein
MGRKRVTRETQEIDGPALLKAFHVKRSVGHLAGSRSAWRNIAEHPLTLAFEKGQLGRGDPRFTPEQRLEAGNAYREMCESLASSGRDSTDLDRIRGGLVSVTQNRVDTIRKLAAIDRQMNARDQRIVRHVCGDGWWPSAAVREACGHGHYDKAVIPRFVEALDSLIDAMRVSA